MNFTVIVAAVVLGVTPLYLKVPAVLFDVLAPDVIDIFVLLLDTVHVPATEAVAETVFSVFFATYCRLDGILLNVTVALFTVIVIVASLVWCDSWSIALTTYVYVSAGVPAASVMVVPDTLM